MSAAIVARTGVIGHPLTNANRGRFSAREQSPTNSLLGTEEIITHDLMWPTGRSFAEKLMRSTFS